MDGQIGEPHTMGGRAGRTTADRKRHLGADRVLLKTVVFDLQWLRDTVIIKPHAFHGAAAVVGECDVGPDISRELRLGHDLEGVFRPGVGQVHGNPPPLHPHVPTAVVVGFVHPGHDRVG